jgi:hypothetical protein
MITVWPLMEYFVDIPIKVAKSKKKKKPLSKKVAAKKKLF